MFIDKESDIPLYLQIMYYLENKIISEEWEKGYRLPSEKELAKSFGVSTITVKKAIQQLVDKGFVYRQRGKGTFVIGVEEQNLSKLVSLQNEAWDTKDHPHETIEFTKIRAGEELSKHLKISPTDQVYKIIRLKTENEQPLALEKSFIPVKLFPELLQTDFENDLLYNVYVKKYQMKLSKARIYFSTTKLSEVESNLLKIPLSKDMFVFERYTYSKSGQVIEYSEYMMKHKENRVFLEVNF